MVEIIEPRMGAMSQGDRVTIRWQKSKLSEQLLRNDLEASSEELRGRLRASKGGHTHFGRAGLGGREGCLWRYVEPTPPGSGSSRCFVGPSEIAPARVRAAEGGLVRE